MRKFLISQVRHFMIVARNESDAEEIFENAFEDYSEGDFEVAESHCTISEIGAIH